MSTLLQIMLGGAAGSAARHLVASLVQRLAGGAFPFGILTVNVAGSLLVGVLAGAILFRSPVPPAWQPLVVTGFLGGFTTFSAFSLDVLRLIERGQAGLALAYVAASVVLSLAAAGAGLAASRAVLA
jgi:CrcB protein